MEKIRLLIVSEDPLLSRGLSAIFLVEKNFEVMGNFGLDEAIHKCIKLQPDAILFDITKDIISHRSQINNIKRECPCSLIFILLGHNSTESIEELIHGVDGIIPKGIMRSSLVKTLELACQSGLFCLPTSLKRKVVFCLAPGAEISNSNLLNMEQAGNEPLTKRETEILQLITQNYSNRQISKQLFISEPTVKTHVSSILRKLGINNRAQAIVMSYKLGLVDSKNHTDAGLLEP